VRGAGRRHDGNKPAQILGEFFRAVTQKIPSPLSPRDTHGQVATSIRAFPAHVITPLIVPFINPFARAFDPATIG